MTITTQTLFLAFFTLAVTLVLTLLINRVRRWRQRQRDEAQIREAEYEDAIRQSHAESQSTAVEPAAAIPSVQPAVAAAAAAVADNEPKESTEPVTSSEEPQPAAAGVIQADRFMAWSPPDADVWQPPTNQSYEVSWTSQKLFGNSMDDFEEANSLPQLRPDQVPSNDGSDYVFGPATSSISAVMPSPDIERTNKELTRAGYHQPHAMQNLQAIRFMMLFGVFFLGGCAVILVPQRFEIFAMLGTIGMAGTCLGCSSNLFAEQSD